MLVFTDKNPSFQLRRNASRPVWHAIFLIVVRSCDMSMLNTSQSHPLPAHGFHKISLSFLLFLVRRHTVCIVPFVGVTLYEVTISLGQMSMVMVIPMLLLIDAVLACSGRPDYRNLPRISSWTPVQCLCKLGIGPHLHHRLKTLRA